MKTKFLIPTVLAGGIAWSVCSQTVAPAPPAAPAGTVQVQGAGTLQQGGGTMQQNGGANGNVTIQGNPNPGGLHKREEFPNVVIPGELRRTLPGFTNGTTQPPATNDVGGVITNQFGS